MAGPYHRPVFTREDPFVVLSFENSLIFKTGNQRTERPLFVNKVAPCRQACPIGIDIPAALHAASKGDMDEGCASSCRRILSRACVEGSVITLRNRMQSQEDLTKPSTFAVLNVSCRTTGVIDPGSGHLDSFQERKDCGRRLRPGRIKRGLPSRQAAAILLRCSRRRAELGGMLRYGIPPYRLPRGFLTVTSEGSCLWESRCGPGVRSGKTWIGEASSLRCRVFGPGAAVRQISPCRGQKQPGE